MDKQEQQPIIPVHEYALGETTPGGPKILIKDGIPCRCHKVQAMLAQENGLLDGAMQPRVVKQPELCDTTCTRALIGVQKAEEGDKLYFIQTCEAQTQKFLLTNVSAEEKKAPKLSVLK